MGSSRGRYQMGTVEYYKCPLVRIFFCYFYYRTFFARLEKYSNAYLPPTPERNLESESSNPILYYYSRMVVLNVFVIFY